MKTMKHVLALYSAMLLLLGVSSAIGQGNLPVATQNGQGIVDANGDGICDITGRNIGTGSGTVQGQQVKRGNTNGPGNGAGNQGNGPKDDTGYGARSAKQNGPQNGSQASIGQGNRTGVGSPAAGNRGRRGGRR